jgi:chemotaxis response regulator CheB
VIALHGIRVGLTNLRPRLRDIIIDAVTNESDIELVDVDLNSEPDLERLHVDVLIVGTSEPHDDAIPSRLLSIAPRMRVLMVATSGISAELYQLTPQRKPLGHVTAADLIGAIRRGAGQVDSS